MEQPKTELSLNSNCINLFRAKLNQTKSVTTCLYGIPRSSPLPTYTSVSAVSWPTQADTVHVKATTEDFIHSVLQSLR